MLVEQWIKKQVESKQASPPSSFLFCLSFLCRCLQERVCDDGFEFYLVDADDTAIVWRKDNTETKET